MAATKKVTKRTTKKVTKKANKKIEFNKYSLYLQTLSILIVIIAITLNIVGTISLDLMLDFFCIAIIILASSLFPKRK